jgi:hypothetical protein
MYKLTFFVPVDAKEHVKNAVFAAGAGRIGRYECCSWEVAGTGQFRPLDGANPAIGLVGTLEQVTEYRVEMVLEDTRLIDVVAALRASHPYEEPAFDVMKLVDLP